MMMSTGELRRGAMFELDGQIVSVLEFQHQKIGRGSAQVRMRLRNVRTGAIFDRTVQAGDRWPRVRLDHRTVQFLYREGDDFHVMDQESYDQFALSRQQLGEAVHYLKEGRSLELLLYEDQPVDVELPTMVELKVEQTGPGFRGDTATGGSKPATLETGLVIQVPLFVNTGDTVRVDTRSATYLTRVSSS
jgi:elongation factor P